MRGRFARSAGPHRICTTGASGPLGEVVEFYDQGGNPNPTLDPELRQLRLTDAEKRALVMFLESLNGSI